MFSRNKSDIKVQRRQMTKYVKKRNMLNFIINDFIFNNTSAKVDIF